ncbi:MAG: GNAT family N-acetyltransferase [Eubacteriaceae bacterium]|nr:GNAT family N-acetyltransferase [Eubacteriaceae bacterium]
MELVRVTKENIEKEHICCAISNNGDIQVASKKAWLKERFDDGLVFLKGDVRGKCFIEYIPADKAWAPIEADNYMYINCLWVSGKYKGQGNSNLLLEECISDSRNKGYSGLCCLSSDKKRAFLADKGYLLHKGFEVCDSAPPFFELMYLPFVDKSEKSATANLPSFKKSAKSGSPMREGFVLYYSHQCPYCAKYVPIIEEMAQGRGVPFKAVRFLSCEQAQEGPSPFSTYSLYHNGEFVSNEIFSEAKFEKLLKQKGYE